VWGASIRLTRSCSQSGLRHENARKQMESNDATTAWIEHWKYIPSFCRMRMFTCRSLVRKRCGSLVVSSAGLFFYFTIAGAKSVGYHKHLSLQLEWMEWTRGWSQNDGALGCSGISDFWSLHHGEKLSKMCLQMGLALVLIDFYKFLLFGIGSDRFL